jgi:hypothetical protein
MATVNFESRGGHKTGNGKGGDSVQTGVDTTPIAGFNNDRVIIVTAALSQTLKVPPGAYERVSQDASGNWTYAPANRNVI